MKLNQLMESKQDGTFVGIKLSTRSISQLKGWMDQNLIDNPEQREDLHITLVVSKEWPITYFPKTYEPMPVIDPATYKLEIFGKDKRFLVLTFESDFLERKHLSIRKTYGLDWEFPTYAPHITLCKEPQGIKTDLELPDFELELSHEYVEAFD